MAVPSNEQAIKVLAVLDTIHDFYKERGVASDDEEDIDAGKMLFIREFIARVIRRYIESDPLDAAAVAADQRRSLRSAPFGAPPLRATVLPPANATDDDIRTELTNLVSYLTLGRMTSITTNFEPNVVKCFEEWYPFDLSSKTKREDTYNDILANIVVKTAEYDGLRNASDILILTSSDDSSFGELTDDDRTQLSRFIMTYFFGDIPADLRLTFDGKAGIVSKVFKRIDQARNVIFPQTIADSAPTSFNSFHGRNEFIFDPTIPARLITSATSNIYTSGQYTISYVNTGFDNKHPFNFSLRITRNAAPGQVAVDVDIPFSIKQTEGPSVNYLISLLQETSAIAPNLRNPLPSKTTTLNIGPYLQANAAIRDELIGDNITDIRGTIRLLLKALMLDIKRTGDNEQVNILIRYIISKIFCSIDHLSILYARLKRQNCIFHVGEKMILFRFPTIAVDPVIQAANAAYWKAKQAQELLDKLMPYNIQVGGANPIWVALATQTRSISNAMENGIGPNELVTKLLRLKMYDIYEKLRGANAFRIDADNNIVPSAQALAVQAITPADEVTIDTTIRLRDGPPPLPHEPPLVPQAPAVVNNAVTRITQAYDTFFRVLDALDIRSSTNIIQKEILKNEQLHDYRFIEKRSHDLFKYNSEPFFKLAENIRTINNIKQRIIDGRYRDTTPLISILQRMGYFTNVENIVNQFYDTQLREYISNILDVNTRCDAAPDAGNQKRTSILELFNEPVDGAALLVNVTRAQFPGTLPARVPPEAPVEYTNINREINYLYWYYGLPQYPPPPQPPGPMQHDEQGGGAYIQKGGAYPGQYYDLSDLLRRMCEMATIYVESIFTEAYPGASLTNIHNKDIFIDFCATLVNPMYRNYTYKMINDIALEWEIGLQEIKSNIGYTITDVTNIITYFLSWITTGINVDNSLARDSKLLIEEDSYRDLIPYNYIRTLILETRHFIEVLQLLTLHGLHFTFITIGVNNSPPQLFKNILTNTVGLPHINLGLQQYEAAQEWGNIYNNIITIIRNIKKNMQALYGGARKPRRIRTRKLHVKRRRTIKHRRS